MRLLPALPLIPLASSAVLLLLGRRLRRVAGVLATGAMAASLAVALRLFAVLLARPAEDRVVVEEVFEWISAGPIRAGFDLRLDPLSAVMILVVTGVGTLIHWYSTGYMAHEERRATYFGWLNLFAFSMLLLVLAGNFLLLYAGWELVGMCSYLLISFYRDRPSAAAAAKKAFVVNRIGDLGFLLGILLVLATFGSLDFDVVFRALADHPSAGAVATAIPLLLFVGATGKSAQIPLHVWLPDAMEGPTPVSALIHAATMVTAGVYMIARLHPLFEASPSAATVVAVVGIATALYAATIAVVQDDIKRVLAYSTISQLGYMFLAVGIGALAHSATAYAAGIFHLVTHAFFKALLFLGAGSVMHALDGETDMKRMGGLLRPMRITGFTFLAGWLAISGIAPFAGFFSKDAILVGAFEHGRPLLGIVGMLASFLTAFYASRQVFLTFFGRSRLAPEVHPHESPPSMAVPLALLGVGAAAGGLLGAGSHGGRIGRFLEPVFATAHPDISLRPVYEVSESLLAAIALAVGLAGIGLAYLLYLAPGAEARRQRSTAGVGLIALARTGYGVDRLYGNLVVLPGKAAARALAVVDARLIDRAVVGVGAAVRAAAASLRRLQTGFVRRYAAAMLLGIVALLGLVIGRGR